MIICSLPRSVLNPAPGHPTSLRYVGQSAHLHAIKILHLDKFLAPRHPDSYRDVPRHCTSKHLSDFSNQDNLSATYQNCTAIAPASNKICTRADSYRQAKSAPYPPCTGIIFWLKYQDPARMLRRVTQPPFIAGPLGAICPTIFNP